MPAGDKNIFNNKYWEKCHEDIPHVFGICLLLVLVVFLTNHQDLKAQQVNWRGVKRDGHFQEKGLLKQWPENGPEKILSVEGLVLVTHRQ